MDDLMSLVLNLRVLSNSVLQQNSGKLIICSIFHSHTLHDLGDKKRHESLEDETASD